MRNRRLSDVLLHPAFLFGVTLLLCMLIRIRLADLPLERDEGEYACAAQALLRGGTPFLDVYNMKFPGVYYMYALFFGLFGQSVVVIRFALICVNLLSTFWIVKIGRLYKDTNMGWLAGGFYLMLSLGRNGQGMIANAEHFVVAFALGGVFFLLKAINSERSSTLPILLSGVFFSTGILMKQHGAFYVLFAYVYMLIFLSRRRQLNRLFGLLVTFSLGVAIPLSLLCLYLFFRSAFPNFFFYTVDYAKAYTHTRHFSTHIHEISYIHFLIEDNLVIWILGVLGLLWLLNFWIPLRRRFFFLFLFLFTLSATVPGYYFRPHYFQLFLPSVAIIAGWFGAILSEKLPDKIESVRSLRFYLPSALLILALCSFTISNRTLFTGHRQNIFNHLYGGEVFFETRQIGEWIKEHTKPDDKIGMFGGEPEIFFYARRRPASGYMYHYLLMEPQPYAEFMTRHFMEEMEKNQPEIFIESNIEKEENNPVTYAIVQNWLRTFKQDYVLIGVVYDQTHFPNRLHWLSSFETSYDADHIMMYIYRKMKRTSE